MTTGGGGGSGQRGGGPIMMGGTQGCIVQGERETGAKLEKRWDWHREASCVRQRFGFGEPQMACEPRAVASCVF